MTTDLHPALPRRPDNSSMTSSESEHQSNNYFLMMMLSLFVVMGCVGNGLVIFVFQTHRKKSSTHIFILTLAIIDFFTCLIIVPFTMAMEVTTFKTNSDFLCKSYHFLNASKIPLSAFLMVAIGVDRLCCVYRPHRIVFKVRRAGVLITAVSILAVLCGVVSSLMYSVNQLVPLPDLQDENMTKLFNLYINITSTDNSTGHRGLDFLTVLMEMERRNFSALDKLDLPVQKDMYIGQCRRVEALVEEPFFRLFQHVYYSLYPACLGVVTIIYLLIYRLVYKTRAQRLRTMTKSPVSSCQVVRLREDNRLANVKTAGMMFVVAAVFIVSFLPAWLMKYQVIPMNNFVFYFYFIYNVANPFIYAYMSRIFKARLKKMFGNRQYYGRGF